VDIDNVNAKQGRHNFELTKIVVERINVKTQKLSIRTLEKRSYRKEFQFPSIIKLFENESDLEDYNMFLEDYDEYNVANALIKGWKFAVKQKKVMRVGDCFNVPF